LGHTLLCSVFLGLVAALPWREPKAAMVKALRNSFNKVQVRPVGVSALSTSRVHPLPLGYHGGGVRWRPAIACGQAEELRGICGAISSRRSFSVALVWLPTEVVVGRLLEMLM
jgi:hypothetical protein